MAQPSLWVDREGYVYAGGIKVARRVWKAGEIHLRFFDKDKRRSSSRGSPFVTVSLNDFAETVEHNIDRY